MASYQGNETLCQGGVRPVGDEHDGNVEHGEGEQNEGDLDKYSAVIMDEAHERS